MELHLYGQKYLAGATSGVGTELSLSMVTYMPLTLNQTYIGLSTTGIPTTGDAIWFYEVASNSGFAHSFTTNYPKVTSKVERFFGEVGVSSLMDYLLVM